MKTNAGWQAVRMERGYRAPFRSSFIPNITVVLILLFRSLYYTIPPFELLKFIIISVNRGEKKSPFLFFFPPHVMSPVTTSWAHNVRYDRR